MGEEVDHINAYIFKLRSRMGTSYILDKGELRISWGSIKLVHYISQYLTQSLTTTVKKLGQRCDQANNWALDA